ncbi:glutamate synthase subunit beta [Sulfurospirillum sp. T05]|uniref:Glutamate synthase subunit beta n=1 Tax=Sulfurospirillum tamanense TaxID=2813362 RepID=A0ABS2WPQ4_9BACT|nr:glutamate synthase subunit beta [Sulfurospirillum tamanensis]MBN2963676.1 glutamate synthase subunit beta [Sulfurospirillum tamanensis]
MQNFITVERLAPKRREATQRIKDFREIYEIMSKEEASSQAGRCIQCGDPFCHSKCPLHNFIPFWLRSTHRYDEKLSFALSNESNPYPEITGRICPHDRLCEGDCTLNDGHGAITIGAIETFISENGFKHGLRPEFPGITTTKTVAVIGAGPAGIAAATYLLRAGIAVSMYERQNRPGGLLTYGIPGFKLEKEVVFRRIRWLEEAGMRLHVNTEVGKDISFDAIASTHDAVFVSIGAETSRRPNLANDSASGVVMAIDFLRSIQQKLFQESKGAIVDVKGRNVVVVGGGDTAMDCIRSSIREGAKSVTCLYRRDKHNMPGSKKEFKNALEEGAEFLYNVSPKEVLINSDGKAIGIEMQKTILGDKDAAGRQNVEVVKGSDFRVDADVIVFALGFSPSVPEFLSENGIEVNKWGGIIVNERFETTKPGIYAGGDCKRGSDLVVTAAAEGKKAAQAMIDALLK